MVIGKFYPPHQGHHFLIDRALAETERVTVIVCEKPSDEIPGKLRRAWLSEVHPRAKVMLIDDHYDENDSAIWAANTITWLGAPPDAVFTSEHYGDAYAQHMGSVHVLVDQSRNAVPCSATRVRHDPWSMWQFLSPPVRCWYAKRICIVGAESTGTTTLAEGLAQALQTVWVPEYGREYSAMKFGRGETEWNSEEFVAIAREQSRREDLAARDANRLLVCDTNAFATQLWHRRYLQSDNSRVAAIASDCRADLYLHTGDEIPFVQDGLRDGEAIRHTMHTWFEQALTEQKVPWLLLRGDHQSRMDAAISEIQKLFENSAWKPTVIGAE